MGRPSPQAYSISTRISSARTVRKRGSSRGGRKALMGTDSRARTDSYALTKSSAGPKAVVLCAAFIRVFRCSTAPVNLGPQPLAKVLEHPLHGALRPLHLGDYLIDFVAGDPQLDDLGRLFRQPFENLVDHHVQLGQGHVVPGLVGR